jgi:hypothetical protein
MNNCSKTLCALMVSLAFSHPNAFAQTDGSARMSVTINDYTGTSGQNHWTVAWVTTESGAFIKTLWKQGTKYAFNSSQWTTHTPQWNAARGGVNGSTIVDGYTSATATSYTGTNSPVILTWNCRDTNNVLVADGNYKFWVQYAEDSGAGPYTTNGLLWTKGLTGNTNGYPNQSPNFTSMQVVWSPSGSAVPPTPPSFTALRVEGDKLIMSGTGPTNGTYAVLVASEANALAAAWTPIVTNAFDTAGNFRFTNTIRSEVPAQFYRLKVQ